MKSYKKLAEFNIPKRGRVLVIRNDVYRNTFEFKDIYPEVEIDGEVFLVKGIESYARAFLRKGDPLGILV